MRLLCVYVVLVKLRNVNLLFLYVYVSVGMYVVWREKRRNYLNCNDIRCFSIRFLFLSWPRYKRRDILHIKLHIILSIERIGIGRMWL